MSAPPMACNYNGPYWADRAFPAGYRRNFVEASRQIAEHFWAKKWHGTLFLGFLNNKELPDQTSCRQLTKAYMQLEPRRFQSCN